MRIMIIGDVHGDWGGLNTLLNRHKPDLAIQVGDFGYYPEYVQAGAKRHRPFNPRGRVKTRGVQLHWCDGNHEDHHAIRRLVDKHGRECPIKVADDVFYQPRGSVLTLPDGRNILFMGGAFSVDWKLWNDHCEGIELVGKDDIAAVPDVNIDIVISHTAPKEFRMDMPPMPSCWDPTPDPSQEMLTELLYDRLPSRWFFGHFHTYKEGEFMTCKWTALNRLGHSMAGAWIWLDDN